MSATAPSDSPETTPVDEPRLPVEQESDNVAAPDARARLRDDCAKLVEPYGRNSTTEPPFSASELVIFGLLFSPRDDPHTANEILNEVILLFGYYSRSIIEGYTKAYDLDRGLQLSLALDTYAGGYSKPLARGIRNALAAYDMPLRGAQSSDRRVYTLDIPAARIFLGKHLAPARHGVFRFLDLPAELRNTIYEYAFDLSGEKGMYIEVEGSQRSAQQPILVRTFQRSNGDLLETRTDSMHDGRFLSFKPPPWKTTLALANCCKQIYKESLPIFFEQNRLQFANMDIFFRLMPQLSTNMVCSLSRIVIHPGTIGTLHHSLVSSVPAAFKNLAKAKRLKFFQAPMLDREWLNLGPQGRRDVGGRKRKFTNFNQIPPIADLVKVAAMVPHFELTGGCPQLREYIEKEIQRLKPAEENTTEAEQSIKPAKKRKGGKTDDDGFAGKRRKMKAAVGRRESGATAEDAAASEGEEAQEPVRKLSQRAAASKSRSLIREQMDTSLDEDDATVGVAD